LRVPENISFPPPGLLPREGLKAGEKSLETGEKKNAKFAKTASKKEKIRPLKSRLLKNKEPVNQCIEKYFRRKRCYMTKKA